MLVLIFDNSMPVAERLAELITGTNKDVILYREVSCKKAKKLLQVHTPHVVLLDLQFLLKCSIHLLKQIKSKNENTKIIILFTHYDEYNIEECKKHGADFIFDKYHEFEKIPDVLNGIRVK